MKKDPVSDADRCLRQVTRNATVSDADFFVDDARWTTSYVKLVLAKPSETPYPDAWTICTEPVPV
jgi:hypothetical protein